MTKVVMNINIDDGIVLEEKDHRSVTTVNIDFSDIHFTELPAEKVKNLVAICIAELRRATGGINVHTT